MGPRYITSQAAVLTLVLFVSRDTQNWIKLKLGYAKRTDTICTTFQNSILNTIPLFECLPVHWSWQSFIIPINKNTIYTPKNKWIAKRLEKDGLMLSVHCTCCKTDMIISEENKNRPKRLPASSVQKLKRHFKRSVRSILPAETLRHWLKASKHLDMPFCSKKDLRQRR